MGYATQSRRFRRDYVGRDVHDRQGERIGRVAETWPLDGGSQPEMLLVRLDRFARVRWVPAEDARHLNEHLFIPYSRMEVEDAPDGDDHRWGRPADIARAHWQHAGD